MFLAIYAVFYFRNADTRENDPSAILDVDADADVGPPEEGRVGHPRLWECAAFEDRGPGKLPTKFQGDANRRSFDV